MSDVNKIPEKTIAFNVYRDGTVLMGVATVELPQLQAMTETISGAGIAGEIDSPTLGHFQSMTAKLSFRTKTNKLCSAFGSCEPSSGSACSCSAS